MIPLDEPLLLERGFGLGHSPGYDGSALGQALATGSIRRVLAPELAMDG
jgi:hypothetical protein